MKKLAILAVLFLSACGAGQDHQPDFKAGGALVVHCEPDKPC